MFRHFLLMTAASIAAFTFVSCSGSDMSDSATLPRNDNSGIDTRSFDNLFDIVTRSGATAELHSMMVLKDGKVIYENYDEGHSSDVKHALWSASKTFTATAVGFAVQDGLLTVNDKVISFFDKSILPETPSEELQNLTVWNLLTMTSGFAHDPIGETQALDLKDPSRFILNDSFSFAPGEKFRYNSLNTYLLSVIVSKVTGKKLVDYLNEKLFTPLGINDFFWKESAEGYNMGGWGLFLRTEDLAKMSQFMLQKGSWNGVQLLGAQWFDEAMSCQIMQEASPNDSREDWLSGYGYQMWMCANGCVRIDGAWGQFGIISPEKNAVIVLNALTNDAQGLLRLVFSEVYEKL